VTETSRRVTALFALAALLFVSCAMGDVTIVRDGRPAAVILVGDDAGPVAYEAAHEIARVIEKATGASLSIYPEGELVDKYKKYPSDLAGKILVGHGRRVQDLGIDLSQLPPEGFVIKTAGRHVVVAGRDDAHGGWNWQGHRSVGHLRGTWFAACRFLEDTLGVRWLWPGELGEVVPRTRTLTIKTTDVTDAPALAMRVLRASQIYWGTWHSTSGRLGLDGLQKFAMAEELAHWVNHQRLGAAQAIPHAEFSYKWLEEFGEKHPEYFALQPSGRRLLKFGGGYRVRMCLSNPGVIAEAARRTIKFVDEHPGVDGYGIAPSDAFGGFCVCDNCKKWGPTISDLVAHHAEAVARIVAKERPGKLVHALSYSVYTSVPQSDVRFSDNVVLSFVGYGRFGYLSDKVRSDSLRDWQGWAKLAKQMVWRPNNFSGYYGVPLVYTTKLGEDFAALRRAKMVGVDFDRLGTNFAADGLNYYVAARLAWNPDANVEAMVTDYCRTGFGSAAPAIRQYFAAVEKKTSQIAAERKSEESDRDLAGYYTLDDVKALRAILARADTLGGEDATIRARIAFLGEALDTAEIEAPLVQAVARVKKTKPTDAEREEFRKQLARREAHARERVASWGVDVVTLAARFQQYYVDALVAPPKPGVFDDLPDAYHVIMDLPIEWRFKVDPDGVGENDKWFAAGHDDLAWGTIRIDDFWEKQGHAGYDGLAWYRVRATFPKTLEGKAVELCVGAADEIADIYIDGKHVGQFDRGWNRRFNVDITSFIKPGEEHLVAVRIYDSQRAGGLWRGIKVVSPKPWITSSKDAWLRRNYPEKAYGRGGDISVGANDYFRTILTWRLPDALEADDVLSAKIVLFLRDRSGSATYAVYPLHEDYDERLVNWKTRDGYEPWTGGAGANAAVKDDPAATAEVAAPQGEDIEKLATPPAVEFDVTPLVKKWADGAPNHGVLIVQQPSVKNASISAYDREEKQQPLRPRLLIQRR